MVLSGIAVVAMMQIGLGGDPSAIAFVSEDHDPASGAADIPATFEPVATTGMSNQFLRFIDIAQRPPDKRDGAERARAIAEPVLEEAYRAVGYLRP